MKSAYINGFGVISPQYTLPGEGFLTTVAEYSGDFLKCREPVYKDYINPIAARRMSRIIKMGIAAACIASGSSAPDAIITGTGMGSVEDTEKILGDLMSGETILNPTPFIQSTYNTISSQIAITLRCTGYNSTYVHRTLSFESALLDALLQIKDESANRVLAGGVDEMTDIHNKITRRTGLWKKEQISNLSLGKSNTPGAIAGEGASFFLLSSKPGDHAYGAVIDTDILFDPEKNQDINRWIFQFLLRNGLQPSDISLFLTGANGDVRYDGIYDRISHALFPDQFTGWYKHLCGEYHTSTGFALYIASMVLKYQHIPEILYFRGKPSGDPAYILIYNHFQQTDHALILIGKE